MECERCGSKKIISISAKCPDGFDVEFDKKNYESPHIENITSGEYVTPKICLDCGQTQGKFPVIFLNENENWDKKSIFANVKWFNDISSLILECESHQCYEGKKFIPADDPENLAMGFICEGCGFYCLIKITNVHSSLKLLNKNLCEKFESREGREQIAEDFNDL